MLNSKLYFIVWVLIAVACSCTNKEKKVPAKQVINDNCVSSKPKLFFNYWGQMDEPAFYCVSKGLVRNHKLIYDVQENSHYFPLSQDTLKLYPVFSHARLLKLSLVYRTYTDFEAYAIENQRLTIPSEQIRDSSIITIEKYLKDKYGKPVFSTTNDKAKELAGLSHEERFTWNDGDRVIVLHKEMSPVYVTPISLSRKGIKIRVIRFVPTRLQIEYADRELLEKGKKDSMQSITKGKAISDQQYQSL